MCSNYDKKSCLSTASFPTAVSESKKTRVADVPFRYNFPDKGNRSYYENGTQNMDVTLIWLKAMCLTRKYLRIHTGNQNNFWLSLIAIELAMECRR